MSDIPTFPPRTSRTASVLGVILLSMVSGAVGTLLLFWLYPQIRQAQIPPGSSAVIIQQPGQVVVEEGTQTVDIRDRVRPLIAEAYHPAQGITIGTSALYPSNRRLGYAVILTRDGWFGSVAVLKLAPKDVLVFSGQPYEIQQIVSDPASQFVVGK